MFDSQELGTQFLEAFFLIEYLRHSIQNIHTLLPEKQKQLSTLIAKK